MTLSLMTGVLTERVVLQKAYVKTAEVTYLQTAQRSDTERQEFNYFGHEAGCECHNESDEHGFDNCLQKDTSFLESDCDEQLLITVAFNQHVKLYSLTFQGPDDGQDPKYINIFINLPRSMGFEEAERSEPTQALELTEDDMIEDGIVPLRCVKFQNVKSVTLIVQSSQGEEKTMRISYFIFIGTPVQATNMNDFKQVVGKRKKNGESH
ncbi:thioredoxin-like protein 1 [Peromyscus leucopus]|uniref:thioredoxin-like protein 1 n=1 Tax=Peromyscus leucopus TaxID=10041 RepID=UPI001884C165|nr:thioredoxin-like protein 1 [Peromyscus leucopus]